MSATSQQRAADRDAFWRAAVHGAAQVLGAHPAIGRLDPIDRQQVAISIATAALDQLAAAAVRRWTGLVGEPCWTCSQPEAEHRDQLCPAPTETSSARARIGALLTAAAAIEGAEYSAVRRVLLDDRTEHLVTLEIDTADQTRALAAELGAPAPIHRIGDGFHRLVSRVEDERAGLIVTITGAWQRTQDTDDAAVQAVPPT